MKGKEWYQASDVAREYEDKRFSRGGRLIDDREREAVLNGLDLEPGDRILEIACGTGRFSVMLAELGHDVIGLDISAAMLRRGREKAELVGVSDQLEYIRGDAARLPFPDNYFDAVFAMRFFHLAPTPGRFLVEMARVSNDVIFFDTFNARSSRSVYNWLLPMGSRLYTEEEVATLLHTAELTLDNVHSDFIVPYGFYRSIPGKIARTVRRFDNRVGRTRFGDSTASVSFWTARKP